LTVASSAFEGNLVDGGTAGGGGAGRAAVLGGKAGSGGTGGAGSGLFQGSAGWGGAGGDGGQNGAMALGAGDGSDAGWGGGAWGGAIYSPGTATLQRLRFDSNEAVAGPGTPSGGCVAEPYAVAGCPGAAGKGLSDTRAVAAGGLGGKPGPGGTPGAAGNAGTAAAPATTPAGANGQPSQWGAVAGPNVSYG
jgi:hypothetical protein